MPLYEKPLRLHDHRLLWWLLANQSKDERGIPTGLVAGGWRERALKDLGIQRPQLWLAEGRLKKAGVIEAEKNQRSLRINGSAFE